MPRPTAQEFLYGFLVKNGGALPEGESGEILKDNGCEIPSAGDMNSFGYELLDAGKIDTALEIFRLNTRLFPKEANAWDSLAEACLRKGDREAAVRYYRKALELNPELGSAKAALDRLQK